MEKCLKIIFWTVFGLLFFGVVYLTTVMYLSPRQDAEERGFIPCTKQLVLALQNCRAGKLGCPLKLLVKDMGCNIGVVGTGVADWFAGKQPTPWANYLFEPKFVATDDEFAAETTSNDGIDDIKAQSMFIEQKLQELEEAKHRQLNITPSELLQNPEQEPKPEAPAEKTENVSDAATDDVSAETDVRINKTSSQKENVNLPHNDVDLLKKIHNVTQEKLLKGNLKDER